VDNPRPEKVAIVAEVQERMAGADAVILTEYRGMTVGQISNLRRQLRESGGEYKVYKNTLVRFAARNLDIDIDDLLTGPTALAYVGTKADGSEGDIAGVAKSLRTFAREVPALIVKGGVLGRSTIDADGARALADMPSRSQVLAQIAGLLEAPLSSVAGLLDAVPRTFLYALQARIDQQGGEPAEPGEPEAA
jgi:large subunit ribosomal protein L10